MITGQPLFLPSVARLCHSLPVYKFALFTNRVKLLPVIRMSFVLPEDCLFDIFKFLRNDFKSLNSCARVNRIWNICVTPMLWSNPWVIEGAKTKGEGKKDKSSSLIFMF